MAGHRGDIINDVDKLMEFIKGTENNNNSSTGTKPKSNVHKSKLHKHVSNAEEKSSKKRRAGSKGKTGSAGNLKKSNSLDEMSSSAKLEDLEGNGEAKVALRSGKSGVERTRERRSWGNTEQLQYQFNASIENLESAEFRVVTKKKKSKKRRNSISHQSRDTSRIPSPELRRTTACSVPHSEKSNDSSDVDSVHSLPIDTKRLNTDENLPISYADIAKNTSPSDKQPPPPKVKKQEKPKITKVPTSPEVTTTTQGVQTSPKLIAQPPKVISTPPDVHNIENFPTIQQPKPQQQQQQKTAISKVFKNGPKKTTNNNTIPNKTVMGKMVSVVSIVCFVLFAFIVFAQQQEYLQNIQGDLQPMPPNITDVRTIEKMHFAQVQERNNNNNCDSVVERTNGGGGDGDGRPPAVVILSGETKEVSGLVFGFEINEKLLSDDVCDSFMSRFVLPVKLNTSAYNHDKIVSFIGQGNVFNKQKSKMSVLTTFVCFVTAWEDVVNNQTNGNVRYYSDNL